MAKSKKEIGNHPEALEKVEQVKTPKQKAQEFVKDLKGKIEEDLTLRETRDEKLLRFYKKRYGIRPPAKSFPFPNASNVHIALSDEKIRKLKPNFMNLIFEGDPIVTFMTVGKTPLQFAQNAEIFMHWLLLFHMAQAPGNSYFRNMALVVDRMLERGKGYAKVVWDYIEYNRTRIIDIKKLPLQIQQILFDPLTEDSQIRDLISQHLELNEFNDKDSEQIEKILKDFRKGERIIKYKKPIIVYNGPKVIAVDDKDLIFPSFTTSLQTVPRITHILFFTANDLRRDNKSGKFNNNVEKVIEKKNKAVRGANRDIRPLTQMTTLESLKRNREGVGQFEDKNELFEIWETYTLFDIDGDGIEEKVVINFDPNTGEILRFIEFPYDHYKWPFVAFDYEFNDDRFYSQRGVPEILDHYQTIVTNQENAKLDRMTLVNSLQFKYRIGAVNMSNVRYIPGQGIGVKRMDDLQELKISPMDISFDTEMNKIINLAESYIGQPDINLNTNRGGERKTAFEVSEAVNFGKQIFSFDARLFKDSLQDLYDQIFELWVQYGDDEVFIRATGDNPVVMRKSDMMGNFVIVPNGIINLLSRTLEEQRAFAQLELATKDQSGAVDQYNAWENYMLKSDPRAAKRLLRNREQFDAIQKQRLDAEQQAMEDKKQIAGRSSGIRLGQTNSGFNSGNPITRGGGNILQ